MLFRYLWLRSTGFPFAWLDQLALPTLLDPGSAEHHDAGVFHAHVARSRRIVVELLAQPAVVEALFLSNPDAVERMVSLGAADLSRPNSRTRQRLRLAWSYLQRFCAKNETCSFFGPLAWGQVNVDAGASLAVRIVDPARGWLRRRRVCFEHWVVDRLCVEISREHESVLPLRLNPGCDLDGDRLLVPLGKEITLSEGVARFLSQVVAGQVSDGGPGEAAGGQPVEAAGVRTLIASGALRRTIAVAPEAPEPLRLIDDAIDRRVPAPSAAESAAVGVLPALEKLRDLFEHGDCEQRRGAHTQMLNALRGAGIDTHREPGVAYAGRLPVYEDCERNLGFEIGGQLAADLRHRLVPLLRMYRLVGECVAALLHDYYTEVLASMSEPSAEPFAADFVVFLHRARSAAGERARRAILDEVRVVLRAAWAMVEGEPGDDELDVDDGHLESLATAVRTRFPRHQRFAGTLGVGIVSPDVMIAAPDLEAILAGELRVVLGEVHPGVLTALQPVALPFIDHPEDALHRADELLSPGRIVLAATSRDYHRSQIAWPVTPNLYEVVVPGATSRCPEANQIPAGRGRVETRDGLIHFVDRETGRADDIVTVLSSDLHQVMFALASEVLGGSRPPRLHYRGVQVKRRSWRFTREDIPPQTRPAEEFGDYAAFRCWVHTHGLPRHSFFKSDIEAKPLFVDWANPLAVDTFAKIAHQSSDILVTEMSPAADELWFADHLGSHTAEFRMSFVV